MSIALKLIDNGFDLPEEILLRRNLAYFAETMLSMEVSRHHEEWSRLIHHHDNLAIEAPRDHGKSFFWSFAYPIWRAYHNWIPSSLDTNQFKSVPRISVGYIFSNTQDQAIKLLELIRYEVESNPKLYHLVPSSKDIWSKTELKFSNGAQIRARGWGQATRGAHPVWVVCDDCLNDESMYSELTREKQKEYYFSAVTPMVVPGGQKIVVGTPFHALDLYQALQENTMYTFKRFPAISEETGEPLWPTRYSKQMLLKRKEEVGSTRFAREYLCIPISNDSSLFPEMILQQCYDYQAEMPTFMTPEMRQSFQVFTGVDLAMSATVGADYTVITTLGVDQFGNRHLLDIRRKRGMALTDQLREIIDVNKTYRPSKILIENNNFQRIFADELIRNTDLPVEGFTTTGHNKNSLQNGVPSLQILFENRKFVIPRKTDRDKRISDQLVNELKCFTYVDGKLQGLGAHDDMVMSLWLANEAVNSSRFSFTFA